MDGRKALGEVMFARVLYATEDMSLMIDWMGIGKLMVVHKNGSRFIAEPWQKRFFMDVMSVLSALGQKIEPGNIFCKKVMDDFTHALYSYRSHNPAWAVMTHDGPRGYTLSVVTEVRDHMRQIEAMHS
ncbi:hypothetical protein [Comamonas testosteroni]|uniref:Uncharacterized protein n=1 Tax=Comamonas testosteroni TaxID=285 RepID=A0A096F7G1_COMTE|nr:hypothetical protein [Comamonas testosteroni]KGH26291.1 hypothetical protein P353_22435 [Comamonas testosteroni]